MDLRELLYEIPRDAVYACALSDLDDEHIPRGRVQKLKELLRGSDRFVSFEAARVLCSWAIEEGFEYLGKFICDGSPIDEGWIPHRLRGYDQTYHFALSALMAYWARCSDNGAGEEARKKIFPPVSRLIELSGAMPFDISNMFWLVKDKGFTEYLPILRQHLQAILMSPEIHHWKIADCAHLLIEFDPAFVEAALAAHGKTLADFPRGY